MLKNIFDFLLAVLLSLTFFIPILFIGFIVKITSKGPAIFWSRRVGISNNFFMMPKFRTMKVGTPQVASHLLTDTESVYTSIGKPLRSYSLDELPQLISILKGDMSFVGPRPALFNQDDLIYLRNQQDINKLKPGITGWAQVNGRDELSIEEKVKFDREYMKRKSLGFDLYIIWLTLLKVIKKDGISH